MYNYGQTPWLARAYIDDVSEDQKTLRSVGQNAHVHDHGFHLSYLCVECYNINVVIIISSIINPKP
jgi:hypothetical protein